MNKKKFVKFGPPRTKLYALGVDESDPFGIEQKKFCEIPSTTSKVISANVDLP